MESFYTRNRAEQQSLEPIHISKRKCRIACLYFLIYVESEDNDVNVIKKQQGVEQTFTLCSKQQYLSGLNKKVI